jgi:signal peptidase I
MQLGLHSEEIDFALNKAAFEVFLEFFKQFEQDQTSKFGITNLVVSNKSISEVFPIPGNINIYPNGKLYDASSMYFTVDDHLLADNKYVPIQPITHDYYQSNIKNPMRKPHNDISFWRIDIGTEDNQNIYREIILDGKNYSSVSYYASYIKLPSKIDSFDSDSNIDINDEIIDEFVIPKALQIILNKYVSTNNEN